MLIDRGGLAEFLRKRREALQPEDVGLPRGQNRRTAGLRREEVAALCHMSIDYYERLERERGPRPSTQMVASMAQGLRLTLDERDHLFRLTGHQPPARGMTGEHVSPGLLRVLDRLDDTPAEIVTELGQTLRQTALGVAVFGDATAYTGPMRSRGYRWFADPGSRRIYVPEDHAPLSWMYAAGLRRLVTLRGPDSEAAYFADLLLAESEEFRGLWDRHQIGVRPDEVKNLIHPELGPLVLHCQTMLDQAQSHRLLVYTAEPGTESYDKLHRLSQPMVHRS
ncbi:transcriptional regulator with XRE-family HTH domain [Catenuloplanes nepalensis]|uniref:Transcriptional regulator with XRE-family HTH domain n=1 Tax=Catenuloplanes nepalensis TaxID=587533 RepID=A0ABT9MQ55_9ACTN|nr:helix-turn-helix transcriptional regulator [Catenuloplanes nepalensis]MDP9793559.1 transcriptional regulator with XRE-family HTH domain [Catenuloplanes nepalensis]